MKIGVDVDGVLANHAHFLTGHLEREYGLELKQTDITSYRQSLPEIDSDIGSEYIKAITESPREVLLSLPIYPDGKRVLNRLKSEGHTIHIATHRPAITHQFTKEWLSENQIPVDVYHDEVPLNKGELPIDVLVDDYAENIHRAVSESGVYGVLLERGWSNCSQSTEYDVSIQSWKEIEDADLKSISERLQSLRRAQ